LLFAVPLLQPNLIASRARDGANDFAGSVGFDINSPLVRSTMENLSPENWLPTTWIGFILMASTSICILHRYLGSSQQVADDAEKDKARSREAWRLGRTKTKQVAQKVFLVDAVGAKDYSRSSLKMAIANKNCISVHDIAVLVTIQTTGPVAEAHGGIQYRLTFLAASRYNAGGFMDWPVHSYGSVKYGLVANRSLTDLMASREQWEATVLPLLTKKYGEPPVG
jgi:hypothetical protein